MHALTANSTLCSFLRAVNKGLVDFLSSYVFRRFARSRFVPLFVCRFLPVTLGRPCKRRLRAIYNEVKTVEPVYLCLRKNYYSLFSLVQSVLLANISLYPSTATVLARACMCVWVWKTAHYLNSVTRISHTNRRTTYVKRKDFQK